MGFILRLMIAREHQGQGYGRAAPAGAIRRLRLHPEVELIATSHRRDKLAAAHLYASLGFLLWEIPWAQQTPDETYLALSPMPPSAVCESEPGFLDGPHR